VRELVGRVKLGLRSWLAGPTARRHALVGPAHLWKMKREFQREFLTNAGLRPDQSLLDVGCGTLRGGVPLITYLLPGRYCGIDVRAEALEGARRELALTGLESKHPRLVHSPDLATLDLGRRFDFVWAFSVLIHMSDEVLDGCLTGIGRHLASDGVFFANVKYGKRRDGNWQGFPLVWRSLDFYRTAAARHGLTVEDMGPLSEHGHRSGIESQDAQRMLCFQHVINR